LHRREISRRKFFIFHFSFFIQIVLVPPPKKSAVRARAKILAQWRGVDYAPLEVARAVNERAAAELLPKALADLRFEARRADAEIVKVWNTVMDPYVVGVAQPANLHKGTLYINVSNTTAQYDINRFHRAEILKRLQACFGREKIKKLFFRFG
jgi:hypothetical protein